ncbi:MAG TPA: DUF2955 domain-containing protein [Sphingomicrobium sp.]|jgi:hypothetical protein|nr:DUF2955 domain-containing protein [Sphingomicrobium sp.]
MAIALLSRRRPAKDPAEIARLHFVLRFSLGTTGAYTICEAMGWQPSALAAVLAGILLANMPSMPSFKLGFGLAFIMAVWAFLAYALTVLLHGTPDILFGVIGLILFLAFAGLANAKAQLPLTLLLICMAVIPVVTLTHPEQANMVRVVFTRGMAAAVIFTWLAFAVWPRPLTKEMPPPQGPVEFPVRSALIGTFIVLPVMLIYWLFGLTDAIPVLLQTVLLVSKIEEERGAVTGGTKLIVNFLGGFIAFAAYALLHIAPNLVTFALIVFIMSFVFALEIAKGGAWGANALLAFNAAAVIFGLLILKGPANAGTWSARLVQFAIACIFAIGMMWLLMPLARRDFRARPTT